MSRIQTVLADITVPVEVENALFQEEQKDNLKFENTIMRFCSFERLGIKKANFYGGGFTQSFFNDVYARNGTFTNVDFTGSTFHNCNFDKAKFTNCNFKYSKFHNTLIPVPEIKKCLPSEPNLRKDLAQNLKMNYLGLGQKNNSDIFLDIEIIASQEELYEIFMGRSEYYRDHYDTIDRIGSLCKYIFSRFSGFLWGYGHKVRKLLISYLCIIFTLSLTLFLFEAKFQIEEFKNLQSEIEFQTNKSNQIIITNLSFLQTMEIVFSESVGYSTKNIPFDSRAKLIVLITRFLGIIYLGLLGATLYRKIAR